MNKYILIILLSFSSNYLQAQDNLKFYIKKALDNNLQLNAERKNFESVKQSKNISRSEFLPNITLSGDQTSTTSTNRTNQSGEILSDSNLDSESKKISVDQKIFSGFKGLNTFKKTELETQKANLSLKEAEHQTILDATSAYFDLIFKSKSEEFNLSNVNLFESKTDLLVSATNFERVTREKTPDTKNLNEKTFITLPNTLKESIELAKLNNIELLSSNLDYEIAVKDLQIERARLSPSASINYSKSENSDFSSTIDEMDQETVKATITWPIIKGGENISSIKKSSYNKQRFQLILKDTKNRINTEISNAWSKYQSFKSVLEATKVQLKAAEIANEGITLEYDSSNTRTALELIQSRSLLLDARIAFAKSERDFIISQFELAKQIGTLSIKSIK